MEPKDSNTQVEEGAVPRSVPTTCYPRVLDATCGSRAMWFDKNDPRAVFFDSRNEAIAIPPGKAWKNGTTLHIAPDIVGSFASIPFADNTFSLVVFDPPHMQKLGEDTNLARFYGRLFGHWECEIAEGLKECFRVLKPGGVLIFKWCSVEIPLSDVVKLAPEPPLFGHNTGNHARTHWMTFMKSCSG